MERRQARGLRRRGGEDARALRAESPVADPPPSGAHATRHREDHRALRGQHLPGRARAPAALLPAPGARVGQVPDADSWLLAVRRGHASGRRHHGRFGPSRGARDPQGVRVSTRVDVVVAGGGANGLIAATTLARAGLKTLLVERQAELGGQGRAVEFAPGFRAAPLATDPGWLPPRVAREIGLEMPARLPHDAPLSVATGSGEFLTLWREPSKAAEAIGRRSASDARRWPEFTRGLGIRAEFLASLYQMPAPDVDAGPNEVLPLLSLAKRFRGLGRADMIELLR